MSITDPDYAEIGTQKDDDSYARLAVTSMDKENVYSARSENKADPASNITDTKRAISAKVRKLLTIVAIVSFISLIAGCFVAVFVKLTSLESKTALLQQQQQMLSSQPMAND